MPQPSENYVKSNLAWIYIFSWWDFIKGTVFVNNVFKSSNSYGDEYYMQICSDSFSNYVLKLLKN